MSYDVILTDNFKKEAKRLIKKYPSLKIELEAFYNREKEGLPVAYDLE